jgi:hypothetical protein
VLIAFTVCNAGSKTWEHDDDIISTPPYWLKQQKENWPDFAVSLILLANLTNNPDKSKEG